MKALKIIQAKPNPLGKDRSRFGTSANQLAGEWVDFQNVGNEDFVINDIVLQHVAYKQGYPNGVWQDVTDMSGTLPVGKIVRVHSGDKIDESQMDYIDRTGADYHIFTGRDYVWNNDKSDYPRLTYASTKSVIDETSYKPFPVEGAILKRVNMVLV